MDEELKSSPATPRRVLLIGNHPADRQRSMRRYAEELARNLAGLGIDVRLMAAPIMLGKFAFGRPALSKWLGHLDKYLLFPTRLLLMRRDFDIVHITDQANALYRHLIGRMPVVVTCHDLLAVRGMLGEIADHRPRRTGRVLQRAILASLTRCAAVACTSDATAQDVRRLLAPRLIGVISNAIAKDWAPMATEQRAPLLAASNVGGEPFFLHVGGNQFYKNRPGVVRLFDRLATMPQFSGHRLVLAGKAPDPALREAIHQSPCRSRITVVEAPSDTMLRALYSGAVALLFPSLYEGFGWPIAEAQACGCVVVTTDREPMRTVGGNAAILIDPGDPAGAARAIAAGLATAAARRERGYSNAERYRPSTIYPRYIDFYAVAITNYLEDRQ